MHRHHGCLARCHRRDAAGRPTASQASHCATGPRQHPRDRSRVFAGVGWASDRVCQPVAPGEHRLYDRRVDRQDAEDAAGAEVRSGSDGAHPQETPGLEAGTGGDPQLPQGRQRILGGTGHLAAGRRDRSLHALDQRTARRDRAPTGRGRSAGERGTVPRAGGIRFRCVQRDRRQRPVGGFQSAQQHPAGPAAGRTAPRPPRLCSRRGSSHRGSGAATGTRRTGGTRPVAGTHPRRQRAGPLGGIVRAEPAAPSGRPWHRCELARQDGTEDRRGRPAEERGQVCRIGRFDRCHAVGDRPGVAEPCLRE